MTLIVSTQIKATQEEFMISKPINFEGVSYAFDEAKSLIYPDQPVSSLDLLPAPPLLDSYGQLCE